MSTPRRTAPTTLAFHSSRIVVDVGMLIVMAGMSLPFVTTPGGNRSSVFLDALPTLFLLTPIFVITLIPDHTRPIPRILGWVSLVLGLAAFPYSIVKYLDASVLADTLGGSVGTGAGLLVIGTLGSLVGIVIGLTRSFLGLETGGAPGGRRFVRTGGNPARPDTDNLVGTTAMPAPPVSAPAFPGTPSAERTPAGSPARPVGSSRPQPRPRPVPARPMPAENPFGSPLFDSLEIPAIVDADKQASLSFEAEDASERAAADDDDDKD